MLENQLELQAAEMERIDGITAELRGVVATSCISCDTRPPLWQIRASAVRHDKLKRTVHFKNAQVRVADIPILYLPRLRIPDPNLKRAAGFFGAKHSVNITPWDRGGCAVFHPDWN